jgi:phage-related protein
MRAVKEVDGASFNRGSFNGGGRAVKEVENKRKEDQTTKHSDIRARFLLVCELASVLNILYTLALKTNKTNVT